MDRAFLTKLTFQGDFRFISVLWFSGVVLELCRSGMRRELAVEATTKSLLVSSRRVSDAFDLYGCRCFWSCPG